MPRSRTYTHDGYLEIQWYQNGDLVCLVSGKVMKPGEDATEVMHQFTKADAADLRQFAKALRRATKQAHSDRPAHRPPCVDGSICGAVEHCPPEVNPSYIIN